MLGTRAAEATSIYERDQEFWTRYIKGRPKIPQSYFDTIFEYHAKHGASFGVAHDVGAGPGIHAPRLLDKFQHVILSDPFDSNVSTARSQLAEHGERYSFVESTLENTIHTQPSSSVDLIFCQSMWHFTKPYEAIAAVAHQLKPGGTFAVSSTGFPVFQDARVWDIWTRMFRALVFDAITKRGGPHGAARDTIRAQLARLDSIALNQAHFLPGALRIKSQDPLGPGRDYGREAWVPKEFEEAVLPPWTEVGADDIVKEMELTDEWTFGADYEGLRDIMKTFPHDHESETQVSLWQEMKELIGDGEVVGSWPYALVLATRR